MIFMLLILLIVLAMCAYTWVLVVKREVDIGTEIRSTCVKLSQHLEEVDNIPGIRENEAGFAYIETAYDSIENLNPAKWLQARDILRQNPELAGKIQHVQFDFDVAYEGVKSKVAELERLLEIVPFCWTKKFLGFDTKMYLEEG